MKKLFLLCVFVGSIAISQQRFLVSPAGDAIPLKKWENAELAISKLNKKNLSSISVPPCSDNFTFGYPTSLYPPQINHVMAHKDVLGQWFQAKASGTIDSIFWYGGAANNCLESLVYIRIHKSIVGKDWGPGIPPYPSPCQSWGYWLNSTDQDNGIGAFPDDATDTTWFSTIKPVQKGRVVPPTRPPFGEELWGQGIGFGIVHRYRVNKIGLMITGLPCDLTVGDKFFFSFRMNSLNQHVYENPDLSTHTGFYAWDGGIVASTSDENWPSRNWKFYEHDSGPGSCAGFQGYEIKRGWVARGNFNSPDTMGVALVNIWYLMTATTNVPPIINAVYHGDVQNTFDTGDQTLTSEIYDCDPSDPSHAAVASAKIEWWKATTKSTMSSVDFVRQTPDITMEYSGSGDFYEGIIPGQSAGTSINYRLHVWDNQGMDQLGPIHSYKVVTLGNPYYLVDTDSITELEHKNIAATGTKIDTSKFFEPRYSGSGTAPKDDGTAGPYSLGGPFVYFGDTMRYAWIGVNGAIALSNAADDTIDVNANGFASPYYDFPYPLHHHRADTVNASALPPNFIAPLWGDIIVGDTINEYGKIRYDNTTYPNEFIAEWDSVGAFFDAGTESDISAFRVVLNRSDGTIKFQYKHTGTRGVDTSALVGICMDSTELSGSDPGFVYINRNGAPVETRPREDWQITFTPGILSLYTIDGWNLLSVATDRTGLSMAKDYVYPGLLTDLFVYTTQYDPVAEAPAIDGFWGKFSGRKYAGAPGKPLLDKLNVVDVGWNIIGTISQPVPVVNVAQNPPGIVASDYFSYGAGGYDVGVTTLKPGLGYWVKVGSAGTLRLQPPTAMPKEVVRDYSQINKLAITDRNGIGQTFYLGEEGLVSAAKMYQGELPPGAPGFNARFKSTGGAVATYPAKLDEKQRYEYPISISAASYPITVRWEIVKPGQKMGLLADGKFVMDMEGSGFVRVKSAKELTWKIGGSGKFIPTSFALGQNYPNPFNPVTKFTVDVPRLTNVEIVVYDLLGRKIRTLVSGEMEPGRYDEMRWDGIDGQGLTAPTGIYFIRMAADEFSAVQKIMLMK